LTSLHSLPVLFVLNIGTLTNIPALRTLQAACSPRNTRRSFLGRTKRFARNIHQSNCVRSGQAFAGVPIVGNETSWHGSMICVKSRLKSRHVTTTRGISAWNDCTDTSVTTGSSELAHRHCSTTWRSSSAVEELVHVDASRR